MLYLEESIPCSARRSINLISNSITVFSCCVNPFFFFFYFFSMSFSSLERTFQFVRREVYRERKRDWKLVNNFFLCFFLFFFGGKTEAYRERLSMKSCNTGIIDAMECRSDESIVVFVLWAKDKWQISKCLCELWTTDIFYLAYNNNNNNKWLFFRYLTSFKAKLFDQLQTTLVNQTITNIM